MLHKKRIFFIFLCARVLGAPCLNRLRWFNANCGVALFEERFVETTVDDGVCTSYILHPLHSRNVLPSSVLSTIFTFSPSSAKMV